MNILVCGAGALGSHVTRYLAMDLPNSHQITVLDFDKVEERNLQAHTQFYLREQKGLPKVEALQYNVYKQYGRKIQTKNIKIEDKMGVWHPLWIDHPNLDLMIDCLDNFDARSCVQGGFQAYPHFDLLHTGFSDQMTFAIEWGETYKIPTDIISGFDLCTMLGAGSFVEMVASLTSQTAQDFITSGRKRELFGNRFAIHELALD